MDLWVREARLFKYGSGTGTNFSSLRAEGERLSGGGKSSGLMSFLKIGDRAAGAIKSGGTTRRAAKMVIVNADHPDIEAFTDWKVIEEQKVAALVAGSRLLKQHAAAIMAACHDEDFAGADRFDPRENAALRKAVRAARKALLPEGAIQQVLLYASQGYTEIEIPTYAADWDSDAYLTVSGQNSNNTVRVDDDFMRAVVEKRDWPLIRRTDGKVAKTLKAHELWERLATAAWASADPGIQFDTTINDWHTCPASGRINASNPCSEYMFLDDTACNLASLEPDLLPARGRHAGGRRLRPCRAAVDGRARDLGADGAVPGGEDRRAVLSLPDPGAGLRQSRRPADGQRPGLRQRAGAGVRRRHQRLDDRHCLQGLGRDGRVPGAVPGLSGEPRAHLARAAQPSPRRPQRDRRLRIPAYPARAAGCGTAAPTRPCSTRRARPGTTPWPWPSGMACATPRSR